MTSKERMLTAMKNGKPDMVPVAPDMSNMIPAKLTGKPFWDIYLYRDPPLWKCYIDAVRHFGFDGWLDNVGQVFLENPPEKEWEEVIIIRPEDTPDKDRIVTRSFRKIAKEKKWSPLVTVYFKDNPPWPEEAKILGLEKPPEKWWPVTGKKEGKRDAELIREVCEYMGDDGVVGVFVSSPVLGHPAHGYSIYDYHDRYQEVKEWTERYGAELIEQTKRILGSPVKPDYILTGGSGLLIWNTPKIIQDLALPTWKEVTRLCKEAGVPTQVHCCGPEKEVIKIFAEETDLNSINPLEIPPMGDCILKEIKNMYGEKLSLMGNLHTTDIMLRGTVKDVEEACRKAIDDAAEGGGFILSTGDQCGRDTPEENIFKMIEVARSYGRY